MAIPYQPKPPNDGRVPLSDLDKGPFQPRFISNLEHDVLKDGVVAARFYGLAAQDRAIAWAVSQNLLATPRMQMFEHAMAAKA